MSVKLTKKWKEKALKMHAVSTNLKTETQPSSVEL